MNKYTLSNIWFDFAPLIKPSLVLTGFILFSMFVYPNIDFKGINQQFTQQVKYNQEYEKTQPPEVFKVMSCTTLRDFIVNYEGEWNPDLYLAEAKEIFKYKFGGICQ